MRHYNIGKAAVVAQIENEIEAQAQRQGKGVWITSEGLTQFLVDTEYFQSECVRRGIR